SGSWAAKSGVAQKHTIGSLHGASRPMRLLSAFDTEWRSAGPFGAHQLLIHTFGESPPQQPDRH
ncbi:MAG: hypothetical protein LBC63_01535, partial [Holophagales bacterium]|nr:hypothetical protein [Holophagales bacterium]